MFYRVVDNMSDSQVKQGSKDDIDCLMAQIRSGRGWLKQLLDILPVGVMITDTEGRWLMSNPEADRINKHKFPPSTSIEEYVGLRLLYKNGKPVEHEDFPLYRVFQKGEVVRGEEQMILYDDGTTTPISVSAAPIYDDRGQVANAVIVLRDMTDKERCEDDLFGLTYENRWK